MSFHLAIDASRYAAELPTGIERYSVEIINGLLRYFKDKPDFEISLFTPRPLVISEADFDRCTVVEIPFPRAWTHARFAHALSVKKPDAVFVPSHVLPFYTPCRSVITIHDVAFRYLRRSYSFTQYSYLDWTTRQAVKKAEKIIVPSDATKQDLIKFYDCKRGKIEIIYHGSDVHDQVLSKTDTTNMKEFFSRYSFDPTKEKFMCYVGRIESKKNVGNILKAFEKFSSHHPAWRLVLAGKPGIGYPAIRKMFFERGLGEKVVMPGYVTEKEKQMLYEHAQFMVFPSKSEGFGFPVLSAFHYKKPLIVSDLPVFHEIAKEGALFINPNDSDELAHAMLTLAADRKQCKMLVGKGTDRLKFFSWEKAALQTGRLFEEMAKGS